MSRALAGALAALALGGGASQAAAAAPARAPQRSADGGALADPDAVDALRPPAAAPRRRPDVTSGGAS